MKNPVAFRFPFYLVFVSIIFFCCSITTAQVQLWGVTSQGGSNGMGVIFKIDSAGNNFQVEHSFLPGEGESPQSGLLYATDGFIYGTTYQGGTNDKGVLFRYDPVNHTYLVIIHFDVTNGSNPHGKLLQASSGLIYGTTQTGGTNNSGVLFEFNPASLSFSKKYDFGGTNGTNPFGGLFEASNGKLYGMTASGGNPRNGMGVIYEYNPTNGAYSKKLDLDNNTGRNPLGRFIEDDNGMLYGMTRFGGGALNAFGTLFSYDISTNAVSVKVDFGGSNGREPSGSLLKASNGLLYGMTQEGGDFASGVLFSYNSSTDEYNKLHDFTGTGGRGPEGPLVEIDGIFYGVTNEGGDYSKGVLFKYNPGDSAFTVMLHFTDSIGAYPEVELIKVPVMNDTSSQNCISVVSNNSWQQSSVVSMSNLLGAWNGASTLPASGTFTNSVNLGQPYGYPSIATIENTEVISTTSDITYFRKEFSLSSVGDLDVRMLTTVDDQVDVYLNGQRVALITSFGRANFKFPPHDAKFYSDGTVDNGFMDGDSFDLVTQLNLNSILTAGSNELILAVRNLGKPSDRGGFSFRMDINCDETNIITKSTSTVNVNDKVLYLYPNPVKDFLNIRSELAINSIRVFDLSGKLIFENKYQAEKAVDINLSNLPKGVYMIEINVVGDGLSVKKVTII